MTKKWWTKFSLLIAVTVIATLMVIPTFSKVGEHGAFPFSKKINLGLDLQGGLYLVMGIDFNKVFKEIVDRQLGSVEDRAKEKTVTFTEAKVRTQGVPADDPRIGLKFAPTHKEALKTLLQKEFPNLRITDDKDDSMELGLSNDYRNDVRDKTLNQSIEVIRNRIDEFGVAEPQISSQGTDRVVVELPGIKDVDRAKDLIGRTAKLEFKMVDEDGMQKSNIVELIGQIEKEKNIVYKEGDTSEGALKFSDYVKKLNEGAKGRIPETSEIAFEKSGGTSVPLLLKSKTEVTGNDLQDAQVGFNQENRRPEVSFELNPKGAIAFEKLTGENIGKRLAIVLDGIVHSAPNINSKIGARGVITTGRGGYEESLRESKDLAIVLRAGALPAQLELMEQRVVGPSLGADSVTKGATASLIGIIFVFILCLIYYRMSGVIAVVSLMMNVILVLAILVWLEATLTLPGIAGIALTVGIAVDSNVVIYERIREELHHGKGLHVAVEAGFDKAFKTILDANVANGIAAVILMMYGTGPVKGFAVTLIIGILTTLFTAVFVCRVLFDFYLKKLEDRNATTISI
ncbi:MAG: protein translocase subunit SecD [Bdellovibrionales bacterium]|nr:protein translocase subunit SecD [Bdellovibrionales bacterium]